MGLQTQMMWDLEEEEIEEEDGFDVQEWEKHREFRLACRGLSTILVQQVHLQELKTRKETLTRPCARTGQTTLLRNVAAFSRHAPH